MSTKKGVPKTHPLVVHNDEGGSMLMNGTTTASSRNRSSEHYRMEYGVSKVNDVTTGIRCSSIHPPVTPMIMNGDDHDDELTMMMIVKNEDDTFQDDNHNNINNNIDHHVDVLQTYNTALCYLCSINADFTIIEYYLYKYPQSLLYENICLLIEDSAIYILQQHTKLCTCQSLHCHFNRLRIIDFIERGYIYFHHRSNRQNKTNNIKNNNSNPTIQTTFSSSNTTETTSTNTTTTTTNNANTGNNNNNNKTTRSSHSSIENIDLESEYFNTLVQLEHNIRIWRIHELTLRNTIIELSIGLRTYYITLKKLSSSSSTTTTNSNNNAHHHHRPVQSPSQLKLFPQSRPPVQQQQQQHKSALSLLACTIGRHHKIENNEQYYHRHKGRNSRRGTSQLQQVSELPYTNTTIHPTTTVPTTKEDQRMNELHDLIRNTHQQLQNIQEKHNQLIQKIRNGRREQFNIFKYHIFPNCLRHDICSMIKRPTTTTIQSQQQSTTSTTTTYSPSPLITKKEIDTSNQRHEQKVIPREINSTTTTETTKLSRSLVLPPMSEVTVNGSFDNESAYSI